MLSGRGLCDELITRPDESYRLCCVVVCDLETSRIGAPYIYDISRLRVNETRFSRFPSETRRCIGGGLYGRVYIVHFVQRADYDPQLIVVTDILIITIVKMYRNGLTIVLYP